MFHNNLSLQYKKRAKKIANSENLSIVESRKAPCLLEELVNLAIEPSTPSKIPVKKTKIANSKILEKRKSTKKLEIASINIIVVAM